MATQPDFLSATYTPSPIDTKLRIWQKLLGVIQNNLGASAIASNNPKPIDTLWVTNQKITQAKEGQTGPYQ